MLQRKYVIREENNVLVAVEAKTFGEANPEGQLAGNGMKGSV
jgi:hypothetical protein